MRGQSPRHGKAGSDDIGTLGIEAGMPQRAPRHDHKAIRALYEGEGYPLEKKAS